MYRELLFTPWLLEYAKRRDLWFLTTDLSVRCLQTLGRRLNMRKFINHMPTSLN